MSKYFLFIICLVCFSYSVEYNIETYTDSKGQNVIKFDESKVRQNTNVIQECFDNLSDGDKVIFPAGEYHTSTLEIGNKNNIEVILEQNAKIIGSSNKDDYREFTLFSNNFKDRKLFIYVHHCNNFRLTGEGIIDGNFVERIRKYEEHEVNSDKWSYKGSGAKSLESHEWLVDYPSMVQRLLFVFECNDVLIDGVTLQNPTRWNLHLQSCNGVVVKHTTINDKALAVWCDGIDISSCNNVLVDSCFIRSGDDAIAIKNVYYGNDYNVSHPSKNIRIKNSTLESCVNGVKIGNEIFSPITDVVVENCIINSPQNTASNAPWAGIAITSVAGAKVENITFRNIDIKNARAPFYIRLGKPNGYKGYLTNHERVLRNILIENVTANITEDNYSIASSVCGYADVDNNDTGYIENVTLKNLDFIVAGGKYSNTLDEVPEDAGAYADANCIGGDYKSQFYYLPAYGFFCRYVKGLTFDEVKVKGKNSSNNRKPIYTRNVYDLEVKPLNFNRIPIKQTNLKPYMLSENEVTELDFYSHPYEGIRKDDYTCNSQLPAKYLRNGYWAYYCNQKSLAENLDTVYTYTKRMHNKEIVYENISCYNNRNGYRVPTIEEWTNAYCGTPVTNVTYKEPTDFDLTPVVNDFGERYEYALYNLFGNALEIAYDPTGNIGNYDNFLCLDAKKTSSTPKVSEVYWAKFEDDPTRKITGIRLARTIPEEIDFNLNSVIYSGYHPPHGWKVDRHPRFFKDIDGDGYDDIIGFGNTTVMVSTSKGDGTYNSAVGSPNIFCYNKNWTKDNLRVLADITGNGMLDIVGFHNNHVKTSTNIGSGKFETSEKTALDYFTQGQGWDSNKDVLFVEDVNGDDKADIIGCGVNKTEVAFSNGDGTFSAPKVACNQFGSNWSKIYHKRTMADIDGDGIKDIVGFASSAVIVAIADANGNFNVNYNYLRQFSQAQGWDINKHIRVLADINDDDCADIVGFKDRGVEVAISNGDGTFTYKGNVLSGFGTNSGWDKNFYPRHLIDLNGDNCDDIIGFGHTGVYVAFSNGDGTFSLMENTGFVMNGYGYGNSWDYREHLRGFADVNGDKKPDIIGIHTNGIYTSVLE